MPYTVDELDNIYDKGQGATDPPEKPAVPASTGQYLDSVLSANPTSLSNDQSGNESLRGGQELFDPRPYAGYMDGVPQHRLDEVDSMRGEAQSASEKLGNALVHLGTKSVSQVVDMIGGMGSLITDWGDNKDYTNGATDAADSMNKWVEETFPMYRSDNSTFAPGDMSWWLQNGVGLVSSMAGFAAGGYGIAGAMKGVSALTGLGEAAELGIGLASNAATAARVTNTGTQIIHAGLLAYAEGAQMGREVFNNVYRTRLEKGDSEQQARVLASQSAATAVQLNTIINGGLNLVGGVSEFFNHQGDKVFATAKQKLAREAGESTEAYAVRLKNIQASNYTKELGIESSILSSATKGKNILTGVRQAGAEGMEELTNQFAQRTGEEEGKKGKMYGFFEQIGQLSHYLDRTMDSEGALNFILGAVAGPGQHIVTHTIPLHKVQIGETDKGEPVYYADGKKVNFLTKQNVTIETGFNNVKDRLQADIESLITQQTKMKEAVASGNIAGAEDIRRNMFNLMNKNSVLMGMGDNLKETYKSIRDIKNDKTDTEEVQEKLQGLYNQKTQLQSQNQSTEEIDNVIAQHEELLQQTKGKTAAQMLGFAMDKNDKSYQEKATEAIEDLDALKDIHEKLNVKYGFDSNPAKPEGTVANFVFARKADVYLTGREFEKRQRELAKLDEENAAPMDVEAQVEDFDRADQERVRQIERARLKGLSVEDDIDRFTKFMNNPTDESWNSVEDIARQYGTFGTSKKDRVKAVSDTVDELKKARAKANEEFKAATESDLESEHYNQWKEKNSGGIQAYYDYLSKKYADSSYHKNLAEHVQKLDTRLTLQKQALAKIDSAPTIARILKGTKALFAREQKELMEHLESIGAEEDERVETENQKKQAYKTLIDRLKHKYSQEIYRIMKENVKLKNKLEKVLDKLKYNGDTPYQTYRLRIEARELEAKLDKNTQDINAYADLMKELETAEVPSNVPPPPPTAPAPPPPPPRTATDAYMEKLSTIVGDAAKASVEMTRVRIEKGEQQFSLNALREVSGISQEDGIQIMQLMSEYLKEKGVDIKTIEDTLKENLAAEEKADEIPVPPPPPPVETTEDVIHDGVADVFLGGEDFQLEVEQAGFRGSRQLAPEYAGASKSTAFFSRDKAGKLVRTSTSVLIPTHSLDILMGSKLGPGTKVKLSIDEAYDSTINNTDIESSGNDKAPTQKASKPFSSYLKDGKIDLTQVDEKGVQSIGEIPMKIVDASGKTIQWLHRTSWILQKDKGDFVNVVDRTTEFPQGGNALRAAEANRNLRIALAQLYNRGIKEVEITVESKSEGNVVTLPNQLWGQASAHLRGNIPLGLVSKDGSAIIGGPSKPANMDLSAWTNRVVALLPGANGQFVPTSLRGKPLDQDMKALHSTIRAIEVYLSNNSEEGKTVEGFDLSTRKGLRNYVIQHFTYFSKASKVLADENAKGTFIDVLPEGTSKERKVQIIQRSDAGLKVMDLELSPDGRLTASSRIQMVQLLRSRYRSVAISNSKEGIKGLNNPTAFNEVTYDPTAEKWVSTPRDNYNNYILQHLETRVTFAKDGESPTGIPTTVDAKGETSNFYPYLVNPIVSYDVSAVHNMANVMESAAIPITSESVKKEVKETKEEQDFASFIPEEFDRQPDVHSTGTSDKAPVTYESLKNLLNFTPLSERNDRTIQDAVDYYRSIGVTHLPKGYNPFKKC